MQEVMEILNSNQQAETGQNRIRSFSFIISVCIGVLLCLGFIRRPVGVEQPHRIELDSRINPNDAPAASIVRLPGIGLSRALAIVAYREDVKKKDGTSAAFQNPYDLNKVRGIGPQTVKNITEWIKFEQVVTLREK